MMPLSEQSANVQTVASVSPNEISLGIRSLRCLWSRRCWRGRVSALWWGCAWKVLILRRRCGPNARVIWLRRRVRDRGGWLLCFWPRFGARCGLVLRCRSRWSSGIIRFWRDLRRSWFFRLWRDRGSCGLFCFRRRLRFRFTCTIGACWAIRLCWRGWSRFRGGDRRCRDMDDSKSGVSRGGLAILRSCVGRAVSAATCGFWRTAHGHDPFGYIPSQVKN
jgi:hypothetical protein